MPAVVPEMQLNGVWVCRTGRAWRAPRQAAQRGEGLYLPRISLTKSKYSMLLLLAAREDR